MAVRPVYRAIKKAPYMVREEIEFEFHSGFSIQQKQRSVQSLQEAFLKRFPESRVLEISTRSTEEIGVRLSAFNMQVQMKNGKSYCVEQIFQSAKTFERGGPYTDILNKTSKEAKKDPRLTSSGKLIRFELGDRIFPLEPKTYFYNWLYINTLVQNKELAKGILEYDSFTDIEFNPQKSINCQAEAAATYIGLCLAGKLEKALEDKDSFLETVYHADEEGNGDNYRQMSIEDFM